MIQCPSCSKILTYGKDLKLCSSCNTDTTDDLREQLKTQRDDDLKSDLDTFLKQSRKPIIDNSDAFKLAAGWLIAGAAVLIVLGFVWLFNIETRGRDMDDLISVVQGVGFMCAGVACGVIAATFAALSLKI